MNSAMEARVTKSFGQYMPAKQPSVTPRFLSQSTALQYVVMFALHAVLIGIITREEVIEFISQQSRRERVIVENARAAAISLEEKGDEHGARPDP